jgi:hypothetical protein
MDGKMKRDMIARAEKNIHVIYNTPCAMDEDVRDVLDGLINWAYTDGNINGYEQALQETKEQEREEFTVDRETFMQFVSDLRDGWDDAIDERTIIQAIKDRATSELSGE